MKTYYFGEPNDFMPRKVIGAAMKNKALVWPAVMLVLVLWLFILGPAWLLVQVGKIGHWVAYSLGYRSHDW